MPPTRAGRWFLLPTLLIFMSISGIAPARAAGPILIIEYRLPAGIAAPTSLASGPDGNVWFVAGATVGRITPQGSAKAVASAPGAVDITDGPDGNLWVTSCVAGASPVHQIVRVTPAGVATPFTTNVPSSCPQQIARGPDGALWYTDTAADVIGRISTAGAFTYFPLFPPSVGAPQDITAGPDNNLWFTGRGHDPFTSQTANYIGRMKTNGDFATFPLPDGSWLPESLTVGPDGNLWFVEAKNDAIGRSTIAGDITEFLLPQAGNRARKITLGPDIKLWFTEENSGKLGRITTAGSIAEFDIPTPNSKPIGIIKGPDNNLWFAESNSNRIAKMLVVQTRNVFLPLVRR